MKKNPPNELNNQAMKMLAVDKMTTGEVADALGIPEKSVHKWLAQILKPSKAKKPRRPKTLDEIELARLQKRIKQLENDIAFLTKATEFFKKHEESQG